MRISDWSSDVCSSDLGKAGMRFDLAAQPGHLHVDRPAVAGGDARLPAQLLAADRHTRAARERGQQIGLGRRQPNLLGAAAQALAIEIEAMLAEANLLNLRRRFLRHPAQDRADAQDQLRSEEHTSELQSLMRIS